MSPPEILAPRAVLHRYGLRGTVGIQWQGMECKIRTTYIIGLFGTGRRYIDELILQNIGERAKLSWIRRQKDELGTSAMTWGIKLDGSRPRGFAQPAS
jgi:hypothetical protein